MKKIPGVATVLIGVGLGGLALLFGPMAHAQTSYDFNFAGGGSADDFAIQLDGKILLAAPFSGERLNADGTLDEGFQLATNPFGFPPQIIYCWAVQQDGKLVAGGDFTSLAGVPCTNLCRFNPDGSVDTNFLAGTDNAVFSIAVQPDGKILVGGGFRTLDGEPRGGLGRLNPDGSLDTDFAPGDAGVFSLAVQDDGKIIVGGYFTSLGGGAATNVARLTPEGIADPSFQPRGVGFVNCLAGLPQGKLLVGALMTTPNKPSTNSLLRLNADGTVDPSFNPQVSAGVLSVAPQVDGKLIVGGMFTNLGGGVAYGVGRVNQDGSLDTTFNPLAYSMVSALGLQQDGKVFVAGSLKSADGATNGYIGRCANTGPAPEVLGLTGSTVTWLRGGTGPELWYTQFQHSTNGVDWVDLGPGTRTDGGWELHGVSLADGELLRAFGSVSCGQFNGPNWFISSQVTVGTSHMPVILTQPSSQTNFEATPVTFTVKAGLEPLSYQWSKNGTNVPGATEATLLIADVKTADAGSYSVAVQNPSGTVASEAAYLAVRIRPTLVMDGFSRGQAVLSVSAQHCLRVIIEASSDLHSWTPLRTNAIGLNSAVGFGFQDPDSQRLGARFYRVRQE